MSRRACADGTSVSPYTSGTSGFAFSGAAGVPAGGLGLTGTEFISKSLTTTGTEAASESGALLCALLPGTPSAPISPDTTQIFANNDLVGWCARGKGMRNSLSWAALQHNN